MTDRPSLTGGTLDPLWVVVRARLERTGGGAAGRVATPTLSPAGRHALVSLLGRPAGKTVDLRLLEAALVGLDVGVDLAGALAVLGHAVSPEPARRRQEQATGRAAREAARSAAADWPEPWAGEWIDEVVRAGLLRGMDEAAAVGLVADCRRVLDALDHQSTPLGRVELAALVLGSAHALDTGSRLEAATTRALRHGRGQESARDLWEQAGAHLDLTSGAALTWNLPVVASCGLQGMVSAATRSGLPLHLTQLALRSHPMRVAPGSDVLLVENPRIVEAAAQSRSPLAVVAANGNPSGAVRLLVEQLVDGGAAVRYHGDFDTAGLAICARVASWGAVPWRMTAHDYRSALAAADEDGVELPTEPTTPGPTPWDPDLQSTFDRHRLVVHEERLIEALLSPPDRAS